MSIDITTHIKWIDDAIAHHEREIARLTIARDALEEADKAVNPRAHGIAGTPRKAKAKARRKATTARGETSSLILQAMRMLERAATSREIYEAVGAHLPQKKVWNALYNLAEKGVIVRDKEAGTYTLPSPETTPVTATA